MDTHGKKALRVLDAATNAKRMGANEKAIRLYREYLDMVDPSFTHGVWNSMAEILFEKKEYDNSLSHCNRALELMKDFIPALELRAKIHNALGNTTAMEEDRNTINKLNSIEQAKWDDPNHYYHYK
ncbi:tetratricopeptide repeat protein [Leptospira levettii]|uniref:Tetratricopeptide repeat protein n=1 Tax=Leptospira levettii TaxID=2023178 RepID=A0ABY2MQS0_9LEPT|nr:hypothetical protein [Leptospira levettii]TGL73163.1 hypothetical protein EHQ60_05255 [Leptospira levettii]TGM26023.1 hypothetical protein EHQ74_11935 [Leptospira levettii]TGM33535.1 hypothetical protein EHQ71_07095 [Leptospira levettii]TGM89445.1 hypothetical protein EHR02_16080 [Leptospira levettii]